MSLFRDAGLENGVVEVESPLWITSQVERGISSRLTRSVAACESVTIVRATNRRLYYL
jgi:hypothetical protein